MGLRVKVFTEAYAEELQRIVNEFLKEFEEQRHKVVDIKFSTSMAFDKESPLPMHSAMIVYEENMDK